MSILNEMKKQLWAIASENSLDASVINSIVEYMESDIKHYQLSDKENVNVNYHDHSSKEDPQMKWIAVYISNRDWSFDLNGQNTGSGGYL